MRDASVNLLAILSTEKGAEERASATVPQLARGEHRGDGVVHAEKLVILPDDLHQPRLVFRE